MMTKRMLVTVTLLIGLTGLMTANAQYRSGRYMQPSYGNLAYTPGQIQITPYAGFLLGDEYDANIGRNTYGKIQQDDSSTWGLRLGFGLVQNVGLEFQYSQAQTAFYGTTGSSFFESKSKLSDVDIHTFLVNVNFDFSDRNIVPYFAMGMGTTVYDVKNGSSESEFTGSLAGGIKARIAPNVALRFEVRGYATQVQESEYSYYWDGYYYSWENSNDAFLTTWESTIGLSFVL